MIHPNDETQTTGAGGEAPQAAETPVSTEAAAAPAAPANWEDVGLSQQSLDLIAKAGFKNPSPIQAQAIPIAMEGHDLICSSQTGTGKTAGFVLPMIERFRGREGTFGLILGPTREIVLQIQQTLEQFATPQGIRSISLIGGVDMRHDAKALDTYPNIICATPGRLCDHLDRGNVWLDYIETVVLDEADRMLDMGFSDQLNRIMEDVPGDRQTLLFSATIPPQVESLARKIQHNPKRVTIGKPLSAAKSVEQRLLWLSEDDKRGALRRLLREEKGTIMVFTRSKDGATRVWRSLHSAGVYDATYIHSDRLQAHREQALAEFKEGKYRILIATDVAGRGIHVDGVAHVVNYDLPFEPEDYVHRIGRTGRASATGVATTFATPRDRSIIGRIEKLIGFNIKALNAPFENGGPGGSSSDRGGDRDRGRGGRGGRGGGRGGERGQGGHGQQQPQGGEARSSGNSSQQAPQQARPAQPRPSQPRPQVAKNPKPISAADFMAEASGSDFYQEADADERDEFVRDREPEGDDSDEGGEDFAEGAAQQDRGGSQGPELGPDGQPRKRRRRRRGGRGRRKNGGGGAPGGQGPGAGGPPPQA